MNSFITAEEQQKQREEYEERIYKLFLKGKITEEQLIELLDK